jgi:hypothetical protein
MKARAQKKHINLRLMSTVITLFLGASAAYAGFRHPVKETGAEATEIENTPIHYNGAISIPFVSRVTSSYAPAAVKAAPAAAAIYGPAMPASFKAAQAAPVPQGPFKAPFAKIPSLRLPQTVKNPLAHHAPMAKMPVAANPAQYKPAVKSDQYNPAPKAPFHAPLAKIPSLRLPFNVKNPLASRGPIPKAPALPAAEKNLGIPEIQLPAQNRDGLLTMKPATLSLKGLNRPQVHAFLKHARDMKLPVEREYTHEVRSRAVAEHFAEALHPTPVKSFRTKFSLSLSKVGKIQQPPAVTQYENMVKRIDSLFLGLDLAYPKAVMGLSELAGSPGNARDLQARDALFAGVLSERAGWETTTAMLLEAAAAKGADKQSRYMNLLWSQLEHVKNPVHLDKIVGNLSPLRARDGSPVGDAANYSMAKRLMLSGKHHAPAAVMPESAVFAQRIQNKDLRDKLVILSLIAQVRGTPAKRDSAIDGLRAIEATASAENQQQARLALARGLLLKGSASQALEFYQNVKKDGKNRLAVLSEQTYAEYMSGAYADSLGKTVALQTPYFQYGFSPDVHLVEIMTRKAMCDFGGAEAGVKRFGERYIRELNALDALVAQKPDAKKFYEELVSYLNAEQPYRYQRYLLQLTSVMENQKTMNQAVDELHQLDELGVHQKSIERPAGWDKFAASLHDRWGKRSGELRTQSAEAAIAEAGYLAQRLRHTFAQVELLDLDISTGAAKNYNLQSALNFPTKKQDQAKADMEKLRWPFEQEIWEDEIDFMKAKNPSKCAVTAGL